MKTKAFTKTKMAMKVLPITIMILILSIFPTPMTEADNTGILYEENFDARADGDTIGDMWGHMCGTHKVGPYLDRAKTFVKSYRYSGIYSYMKTMYGRGVIYEWAAASDDIEANPTYWGFSYPTGYVQGKTANFLLIWRGPNDLRLEWWSLAGGSGYQSFPVAYANNAWIKFKLVTYEENTNIDVYINETYVGTATIPDHAKDAIGGFFQMNAAWGNMHAIDDVKFYKPTPSFIDIDPDTLNLKSKGQWITAYITLPEGYDVEDIVLETVYLEGIQAITDPTYGFVTDPDSYLTDHNGDGILERMVKFDRATVIDTLTDAIDYTKGTKFYDVTLIVTGQLEDGTLFKGTDTIVVKKK